MFTVSPSNDGKTNFHDPKNFHDRTLLVEGQKFYVQSGLLSVWSEFFRNLFNSDFKEKKAEQIKLEELSSDDFETFLRVIYAEYFDIEERDLELLICLSQRFLAPNVLTVCTRQIERDFKTLDKPKLLDIACKYNIQDLKKKILKFIDDNDNFHVLDSFMKVAFDHNLESLQETYRWKSERPESAINIDDLKSEFSGYKGKYKKSVLSISLNHNGTSKLNWIGYKESPNSYELSKNVEHLLYSEVIDLSYCCEPTEIVVENMEADEIIEWWNSLEEKFPAITWKISLTASGLADMWQYNVKNLSAVLAKVAAKMIQRNPQAIYIDLSKRHLTISTEAKMYPFHEQENAEKSMFTINFAGDWNLPTSYGTIFPILFKNLLRDQKLVLFMDLPCQNCIEWIFKHMNWTFDNSTSKPVEEYGNEYGESDAIKDSNRDFYRMSMYNKFTSQDTDTEVTYFYLKHCIPLPPFQRSRRQLNMKLC